MKRRWMISAPIAYGISGAGGLDERNQLSLNGFVAEFQVSPV
jgi:hypothetical protein